MPEEVVLFIAEYASTAYYVAEAVAVAYSVYATQDAQRKSKNEAKDAYNASLKDRYIMQRGASQPRQIVLGRARVSGPMFFVGSYGANREHLMFTVALAAHEIDAIEQIYFDDRLVILDGSGNVTGVTTKETFSISSTGGAFTINDNPLAGSVTAQAVYGTTIVSLGVSVAGKVITVTGATGAIGTVEIYYQPLPSPFNPNPNVTVLDSVTLNGSGNGSVVLAHTPITGGTVIITTGSGQDWTDLTSFGSLAGNTLTVTGAGAGASSTVPVQYVYTDLTSRARVRKYLGAPGQAADAAMITNFPGVWTSAHTASNVAYLVVEFDYDPTAFPSGLPNVSALVRGAKVYDPRTGSTAWSENPALLARHYALSPLGGRLLSSSYINDTKCIAAANVCDQTTNYVVNGQTYTRPLFKAGTASVSNARPQDVLNDITQAMAGKWVWIDGQLCFKAGSFSTPVMTLDETWLVDTQPVHVQPKRNRSDVFNVVTATFSDERQNYQVLTMPRIAPAAYITEDGIELPLDVTMPAVQFTGQAQHVAGCQLRDARASIQLTVLCNMKAYPLEVFDVIYVTLSRFGWVNKTFEVLDISWTLNGGIQLSLKEIDATIYTLDAAFLQFDAGKATKLPSPFKVDPIAGLTITSGVGVMSTNTDGTVLQRMLATWTAATDPGILDPNGGIEIRYGLATLPDTQWTSIFVDGHLTSQFLPDVLFNRIYVVKARGFNAISTGVWCNPVLHKVGGVSIVVDTPQLAANAATDFAKTTPANGTRTSSTYSGAATILWQDDATLTYTNSSAATLEVEVFGSLVWQYTTAAAGWVVGPSFRGTNDVTDISDSNALGVTSVNSFTPYSFARSFSVAAGKTLTLKISSGFKTAGSGAAGAVYSWSDLVLKYNVLKR